MAKVIMIQGTMSNAGKSLICAGLCRIFKQDGYRVAPFKSQNMALNSYVTDDGLEMGRAQVVQAMAAGVKPSVYMNPILLKPTNDVGSQVILNGSVLGDMSAKEYFKYKKKLIPQILTAFNELAKENDIIVIEGAGSPAEINLKADDIVNMGMAKLVDAPVLIAGDIDRGGVFAQLYGTVKLLNEDESNRVKGFIINKFRGDKSLLEPGLDMLRQRCGIDTVGVIPYMNVDIEDEDSLTERFNESTGLGPIKIAVIKVPRISNFTDFLTLENHQQVSLNYVSRPEDLTDAHMIILPGTKNTIADMQWMKNTGMDTAIKRACDKGCVIFGICGGYQMLGESIRDDIGVEQKGVMGGLNLLPVKTRYCDKKIRSNTKARINNIKGVFKDLNGMEVKGYEIHMGISEPAMDNKTDLLLINNGGQGDCRADGICTDNVYGTYLHGFFDADGIADAIVKSLAKNNGINLDSDLKSISLEEYRNSQFDILADTIRENLDMKYIYQIMNEYEKHDK